MTTAPPPSRAMHAPGHRPGAPAPGNAGGSAALDPVKLLRQYYPYLILALMVGTGLGVAVQFILLKVYPRFTSTVIFECRGSLERGTAIVRSEMGRDEQERFQGTQVNLMTSRMILDKALDNRDLAKTQWIAPFLANGVVDKPEALIDLEKKLSARPLPQSNLIQMRMTTATPDDSATIVNAVADAYIADHRRTGTDATGEQQKVLGAQVKKLEDDLKRLKGEREQEMKAAKLDAIGGGSGPEIELADLQKKMNEIVQNLQAVSSQLDDYKVRMSTGAQLPDDLRAEAMQDPVIRGYDQKLATLRDNIGAMRKQGIGESHSDIKSLKAQIDEVESQRQEQLDKICAQAWAAQISKLDGALRSLTAQYDEATKRRGDLEVRRQEILQAQVRVDSYDREIAVKTEDLNRTQISLREIQALQVRSSENAEAMGDRVRIISRGVIPKGVSFPKIEIIVPLTAFLVTGLVGGVLFLRELLDQRVRGPSDAAMVPRVKVLGIVPDAAEDPSKPTAIETVFRDNPTGVLTESYRQMRAPLIQAMERSGHKSLVVLGAMPGSGATSVATNLALAVAGADERVLIVDANFRRPAMHRVFKLQDGPGLGDILAGTSTLDQAIQPTSNEYLKVVTAGSPTNRAIPERLAGEAMSRFLLEASSRFDMIIVDVPPAVVSGDGYAMANKCDASVIVCRAMVEKRGLLARVRNQIGEARAECLGVVVNAVRASAGGYFKKNIKATHAYQSNGKA
jgi:capsular exopolysaccharide synthesis family protein